MSQSYPPPYEPPSDPYSQNPYGQNPYGQSPTSGEQPGYSQPPAYGPTPSVYGGLPLPGGVPGSPDTRPGRVSWSGGLTIGLSSLALVFTGLLVLIAAIPSGRHGFVDGLTKDDSVSASDARTVVDVVLGVSVALALMSLVGIVLGVLVLRRSNGARISLVVLSLLTAVVSLPLVLGYGLGLLTLVPSVTVAVLLLTGPSSAWFRRSAPPALPLGTSQPWG